MKILQVGDIHFMGTNPIGRKDFLPDTLQKKLKECVSIANKYSAPIICVGDIFHTEIVSNSIVNQFGDIINKLKKDFYFIFGNHDLQYHSLDLWDRTSLGVLYINNPKVKHISEASLPFDYMDWDQEIEGNKTNNLLLCHKAIVSQKQLQKNFWMQNDKDFCNVVSEKQFRKYNLILCGHWHKPYTFTYKNTLVNNSGAVARIDVGSDYIPKVSLIDLDDLSIKDIPLKTAKPFKDVISKKHLMHNQTKKENKIEIEAFVEKLKNQKKQKATVFSDALTETLKNKDVPLELRNKLQDILVEMKE